LSSEKVGKFPKGAAPSLITLLAGILISDFHSLLLFRQRRPEEIV
jgi:hypothetical protein